MGRAKGGGEDQEEVGQIQGVKGVGGEANERVTNAF